MWSNIIQAMLIPRFELFDAVGSLHSPWLLDRRRRQFRSLDPASLFNDLISIAIVPERPSKSRLCSSQRHASYEQSLLHQNANPMSSHYGAHLSGLSVVVIRPDKATEKLRISFNHCR